MNKPGHTLMRARQRDLVVGVVAVQHVPDNGVERFVVRWKDRVHWSELGEMANLLSALLDLCQLGIDRSRMQRRNVTNISNARIGQLVFWNVDAPTKLLLAKALAPTAQTCLNGNESGFPCNKSADCCSGICQASVCK